MNHKESIFIQHQHISPHKLAYTQASGDFNTLTKEPVHMYRTPLGSPVNRDPSFPWVLLYVYGQLCLHVLLSATIFLDCLYAIPDVTTTTKNNTDYKTALKYAKMLKNRVALNTTDGHRLTHRLTT